MNVLKNSEMVMDQTSVKLKKKMLVPHLLKIYFGLG